MNPSCLEGSSGAQEWRLQPAMSLQHCLRAEASQARRAEVKAGRKCH